MITLCQLPFSTRCEGKTRWETTAILHPRTYVRHNAMVIEHK